MKKICDLWSKLDVTVKACIACMGMYMFLYVLLSALETMTDVSF